MRVLALDTTTRLLSAAVVEDDRVLADHVDDSARSQAERLPGDLFVALEQAGVPLGTIDVFAIAAGPGSFTGLRIGIATMQGLAFVGRRRMVAVSALEAVAHGAARNAAAGETVGVWIDAHRREVFSALYRVGAAADFHRDRIVELDPPSVGPPASTLGRWHALGVTPDVFAGNGVFAYESIVGGAGRVAAVSTLAPIVGRLAVERARTGGTIDPAAVQPIYIRRPDAELARDKRCG